MGFNQETLERYAPVVLVVVAIIIQNNLFVTPEKLEIKHREILQDVANNYTTKDQYNDMKQELSAMRLKIDKIYEIVTRK